MGFLGVVRRNSDRHRRFRFASMLKHKLQVRASASRSELKAVGQIPDQERPYLRWWVAVIGSDRAGRITDEQSRAKDPQRPRNVPALVI